MQLFEFTLANLLLFSSSSTNVTAVGPLAWQPITVAELGHRGRSPMGIGVTAALRQL